jgi:hypothetical protein
VYYAAYIILTKKGFKSSAFYLCGTFLDQIYKYPNGDHSVLSVPLARRLQKLQYGQHFHFPVQVDVLRAV